MLDQWTELFRGTNEPQFDELVATLEQNGIETKTDAYTPGSKMAAYGGTATVARIGYVNPATLSAAMEEPDQEPRLFVVKVRKRDLARARELLGKLDA